MERLLPWSVDETPYPKRVIRLPKILSPEEIGRLIDSATTPFYRTILMTLYATGVRRAELAHLKVSDIDSQRMVIHAQGGPFHDSFTLSAGPTEGATQ
jgi:integrase/recombinase XerD